MNILTRWLDNNSVPLSSSNKIDWARIVPFVMLHLSCLLIFIVGVSKVAIIIALTLYWARIFSIGAFYHRYFSHRTFKTNRAWQFIFAVLGSSSAQRGPIWWAAHHRHHHQVTDTEKDPHSPWSQSFWKSHLGWFLTSKNFHYDKNKVKDLLKFPELCWIDRYDVIVPILLMIILYLIGETLKVYDPGLKCTGAQLIIWGFSISTVATLHTTVSINSFGHKYGTKRYKTGDQSRNNFLLALLTFGEGWHNNHHRYPATARQGFHWWEIDITYYILITMEKMKIIKDLKRVPKHIIEEKQKDG